MAAKEPRRLRAVIVDLDGTLARLDGRGVFDFSKCDTDAVCHDLVAMLTGWRELTDGKVVIVTGRQEEWRERTARWLIKHDVPFDELFMRANQDGRPSDVVKRALFTDHISYTYDIAYAIDDRLQDVRMWRDLGIPTMYVGDFTDF